MFNRFVGIEALRGLWFAPYEKTKFNFRNMDPDG